MFKLNTFKPHKIPKHLLMQTDKPSRPWWQKLLLFLFLGLVLLLGLAIADMARGESMALDWGSEYPAQLGSGTLLLKSSRGYAQALHLNTDIKVQINGMVAEVTMTQEFKNPSEHYLEGVYTFPLQEKTAVNGMTMIIGERRIVGKIKEKKEAQKIYQAAKKAGKRAALTQQQRPNLFQQKVANIGPQQTISVELRYIQPVQLQLANGVAQFSLRIPTTITPRYTPAKLAAEAREVNVAASGWGQVDVAEVQPAGQREASLSNTPVSNVKNPMSLAIRLRAGLPLASLQTPYHQTVIDKRGDQHELSLLNGVDVMNRDFELQWQPVAEQQPQAAFFLQSQQQQDFGLLMVQPPQLEKTGGKGPGQLPRELIFIIDSSGSMGGESMRQAKAGLLRALASLSANDRFNIIEFNSTFQQLFPRPVAAGDVNLSRAQGFVRSLVAGGGTQMLKPLLAALTPEANPGFIKQVVFITDGAVSNEAQLFKAIHQTLGQARLFTVAIGSAPNSFFMRKAAEYGRGSYTSITLASEVEEKISTLFNRLSSPVLSNIRIQWPQHLEVEAWPQRIPDLYAGEPLVVYAKLSDKNASQNLAGEIQVEADYISATGERQRWYKTVVLAKQLRSDNRGIASLWGREKIADLMDQKIRGAKASIIREQVLVVALQQQLLSKYTSFVAVEEEPTRPLAKAVIKQQVANTMAKGQQRIAYPATATSARWNIMLGATLLLLSLLGLLFKQALKRRFCYA